jgi:hypothetical protein
VLSEKIMEFLGTGQFGDHGGATFISKPKPPFHIVEHFISFLKSPRSSKSEFGAKSYAQNTKGWCC